MPASPVPPLPPAEGLDEAAWVDVIHKMDEVYSRLIEDEIALEQKNAQLEESHRFIFSVLSAMSDLVLACSESGEIQDSNDALRDLVGSTEAGLRGRRLAELLARPEDEAAVRALTQAAALAGPRAPREPVELHLRDAAGSAVPVEVHCSSRFDANGLRSGFVFVGRPVGELRRAYQQLQDAHNALKQTQAQLLHSEKMASLGRLVAGVAHELNNPISFVLGNVHALKRYCERLGDYLAALHAGVPAREAERLRAHLKIDRTLADFPSLIEGTLEGATRTAEIVAGLKRFSAMDDREEAREVALDDVVARAALWVGKGTGGRFAVTQRGLADCIVRGSPGQLMQVFMNLIQNAWDATSAAGVEAPALDISASLLDAQGREFMAGTTDPSGHAGTPGRIGGGAHGPAERVRVRFSDNGPGIPAPLLGRIFDPFYTTKPVGKGTGLGLSISYGIVEQHGGRLSADSAPGGGAVFTVELPLAPP
ncbi:sensor histidine kinase [Derxia gummosa]|uniref:histidine kinase n=1 Tax=Derxia gummosa DSM 723 TaxID=1121388 RepID=A0A8B6X7Z2_9BURK|nr:ATP-binding protein [Derxia gummosa]